MVLRSQYSGNSVSKFSTRNSLASAVFVNFCSSYHSCCRRLSDWLWKAAGYKCMCSFFRCTAAINLGLREHARIIVMAKREWASTYVRVYLPERVFALFIGLSWPNSDVAEPNSTSVSTVLQGLWTIPQWLETGLVKFFVETQFFLVKVQIWPKGGNTVLVQHGCAW